MLSNGNQGRVFTAGYVIVAHSASCNLGPVGRIVVSLIGRNAVQFQVEASKCVDQSQLFQRLFASS